MKYLAHYPEPLQAQVRPLAEAGRLGEALQRRFPQAHDVRTDGALYDYTQSLKSEFMRNAQPLSKVLYDSKLHVVRHALGTHTTVSRVQGQKLKARHEIRVASLFREVPLEWLRMIVVHELAHLKVREHDKAFYALCTHMEPAYHQHEFDLRLYMTHLDLGGQALWTPAAA
ncbi:YgjP-like metallopeptidase domain-containing protein [Variovorax sp. OV329]|uniref:YgjP-like metallopeptidase domain-containing protein n=1 Tax=Variovorax sp. OV329 TaxID=1882825 RepID=UPI000B857EBD|nr:YgjP-like metallopeptidase domain-containing protein [Variovorax sp. OV329]